ncbi:MAG: RsmF rRNA methyltransferase first C-terminal domain-containing protein, partial [Lachnospiraceae bacterium]|nr:RsmF rRNA methyltransferase first C-terminal domain-containing protein [Lachnospiraceae bacterium]
MTAPSLSPDSLPQVFLERMRSDLRGDASYENFLQALSLPPVRSLRLNTLRSVTREDLPFSLSDRSVPWEPDGFYLTAYEDERPGRHPLHEAGAYYLQEASAMAPARLLFQDLPSGESAQRHHLRVLDLCAAPGGKTIDLASLTGDGSLLVSNEIHPSRAKILSQNVERMGIAHALVLNETPERLAARFPAFFDRILVDAPCSGEGMFRKNPEAVTEWSPENVAMCAERQHGILDAAWQMLSPGGRLVYSTCTWAPAEDEEQIARFLADHRDASLIEEKKLFPHEAPGEGHYCALIVREGSLLPEESRTSGSSLIPSRKDDTDRKRFLAWAETSLSDSFRKSLSPSRFFRFGEMLYQAPPFCPDLTGLHVLRPGLHLSEYHKDRLEPAHALSHVLRTDDA